MEMEGSEKIQQKITLLFKMTGTRQLSKRVKKKKKALTYKWKRLKRTSSLKTQNLKSYQEEVSKKHTFMYIYKKMAKTRFSVLPLKRKVVYSLSMYR